jgi:hypothetical protein
MKIYALKAQNPQCVNYPDPTIQPTISPDCYTYATDVNITDIGEVSASPFVHLIASNPKEISGISMHFPEIKPINDPTLKPYTDVFDGIISTMKLPTK